MNGGPAEETCTPVVTHAIGTEHATALAGVLKALADPLRLRMLSALAADPRGEACVCDLAGLAEVSQPTISHHLRVLKDVGVLTSERRGTWVWYRIDASRRSAVTALLDAFAPATLLEQTAAGVGAEDAPRPDLDAQVTLLAQRLAVRTSALSAELVTGTVRDSFAALARTGRVSADLLPLTAAFAEQRLADLVRDRTRANHPARSEPEGTAPRPQLLFVCTANAGRSQLAAALAHHLSQGSVIARSAGAAPAARVHPPVRALLDELVGDEHPVFPKPLTDEAVRAADVVVTLGCGDVCPVVPGVRYEDWAVGNPALASAEGVAAIRDDLEARVRVLLASLHSAQEETG
ncbi:metalloregulator ArsR/SmtB family transcription factor [Brevibacterium sp.]|uniref:metalloregulator ArsR/SmtB family transcription factor n=1 Tax=Brevibacterium sp. TaxID=1701 RepID=UPI0025B97553|nr:metalloregulator ArsR/SmtB family transcription factor [Brevibacterium sp.]